MGRPLSKKYFGNRNIGTGGDQTTGNLSNSQNYSDDRIGGEGVASYTVTGAGTGWTSAPTVTFSATTLPGGVNVTGTVHYKALSFDTTANGTGYKVGDVLEVATGTATTKARAPVASIITVGTPSITNGGSLYDVSGANGDRITYTHANLSTPYIVEVTTVTGSTVTGIEIVQEGVWTGAGAAPTSMAGGVGGFTATTTARAGGGGDNNGTGLVLGFATSNWGVYSFGTVSVDGDYTEFPSTGTSGTLDTVTGGGSGAKATITMGLLSITVDEKGSGYINAADAAVSFSGSTGAAATAVLTTDSGVPYASGNQENAIIIYANTSGGGSTGKVGDIIKQTNARSYKVKTADGIGVVKLGTDATPATGEAYIVATAASGGTYYVTKLTAHKATLVAKTGDSALDGQSVQWTFSAPSGSIVQIENA